VENWSFFFLLFQFFYTSGGLWSLGVILYEVFGLEVSWEQICSIMIDFHFPNKIKLNDTTKPFSLYIHITSLVCSYQTLDNMSVPKILHLRYIVILYVHRRYENLQVGRLVH